VVCDELEPELPLEAASASAEPPSANAAIAATPISIL
jgi:hypothetical protein